MHIIFFAEKAILPLTYTRPVADLRIGVLTIAEKWLKRLPHEGFSFLETGLLAEFYEQNYTHDQVYINAHYCPSAHGDILEILNHQEAAFFDNGKLIALRTQNHFFNGKDILEYGQKITKKVQISTSTSVFELWHIFQNNRKEIFLDYALLTHGRVSAPITDAYTRVYGLENIFIEEGVNIKAAILNAEQGVIYIGKNAQIEEGAIIRGATAICEGATVNTGAKIRGDSTIGPFSKVGGEVSNSVLWGYSNKGHDGFLGNSVLGAWCNLGADTNNSNLKNNYAQVSIWGIEEHAWLETSSQFVGLFMGDHSKAGINTMFNTGTVVGMACNIFGSGFPPKYIPSFSWGTNASFHLNKVYEMAEAMMNRRNLSLSEREKLLFEKIFMQSNEDRRVFHTTL